MKYLFIVGVGRSGTSLLQSMFAAHSKIAMMPETGFVRRYLATGRMDQIRRSSGIGELVKTIEGDSYFDRLDTDLLAKAIKTVSGTDEPADFKFYATLLDTHASNAGATFAADKDPRSIEYLKAIKKYFPKAHIIHIIRDPRAVLSSKKRAKWSMQRHPIIHIFANRVQLRMGRQQGRQLFGARYQEVLFEELLTRPDENLKHLTEQMGLSFERAMVEEYRNSAKRLVHRSEMSWKKETLGPILTSNISKWRNSLSVWEIALSESTCTEAIRLGDYEKTGARSNLPVIQVLANFVLSIAIKALCPIYQTYRSWKLRRFIR